MGERIHMSQKELDRLEILRKVHDKCLTIKQAASILALSERHVKRLSKALKKQGPIGLISKRFGASSNHKLPIKLKENALKLIQERYSDFGPTLAQEYLLEKHGIDISVGTTRNIMIENGIWISKRIRKKRIFQLRDRRKQKGDLIQIDGSEHDWFEGRGPKCTLLVYIDDATSAIQHLMFAESESVFSYFAATKEYVKKHGRPLAFYSDKHAVFRVNREGCITGTGLTQFGRAMKELDIKLICANTPQAKGRVERRNRDLQNRLIKAMRLSKISTIEEANTFLPSFIEDFNKRFARPPQNLSDAHRNLLSEHKLERIFTLKHIRHLSKNLTLQYKNVIYQIITDRESYAMRKAKVTILETMEGQVIIEYKGTILKAIPYNQMQSKAQVVSSKEINQVLNKRYRPGKNHPWKRYKLKAPAEVA